MSEELIQKDLINNPAKIGKWDFYNIGATTIRQLKENGIIRNVDYEKEEKKKVDGLLVLKKNVIAVVEYKKPSQFNTKAKQQKAIKQELEVARKLKTKILIATDTKESIWINVLTGNVIKDENANQIKINFDPKSENIHQLIEKIYNSINEKNDQIKSKKLVNPTGLAKQIWQDIWSVSGATPENCLYTFVELFIFKYLSDLQVLKGVHNFYNLLEMYKDNTEAEALQYYADVIRQKIKELFPMSDIDKTTIINGTIFVSKDQKAVRGYSTVFKKVLLRFYEYGKLEHIDYDFKSQLFESFLKESISKKNWGQFFTPLKVVRAIVEMVKDDIKPGIKICDPACGVGKFLLEPIKTKLDQFYKINKNGIVPQITIHGFDKGFDKDEQKTIIMAKANMLIYFSDLIKENAGITKDFAKLFNESFVLKTNSILGTLSEPVKNEYDLILTNPPYVTSGSSNLKEEIKKDGDLEKHYKINAMGVEGLFMEWILNALKPGGKAFVIVPDGIFNRQTDKKLRKSILEECHLDAIISLPEKTFFTTSKKTYILAITKKHDKSVTQTVPVFTYLVSEMGETRDIYRFDIEQDDLQEAVMLFSFFRGSKTNFEKINTDKRCKIQPINKFIENIENSWIIDDWWDEEEKIKLKIKDKEESIKFDEFPQFLDEIANNILNMQEMIKAISIKKKILIKKINIAEILTSPSTNSGLKKSDISQLRSDDFPIPVYSASMNENAVLGWVSENSKWKKYKDILTWNKDGSTGLVFYRKNIFVPYEKVKLLKLKDEFINLLSYDFLKIVIQDTLLREGYDFKKKCSMARVMKLKIPIPYEQNGNIDIENQKEIIEKYNSVQEIKKQVKEYKYKINNLNIDIKEQYDYREVLLDVIFETQKGLSGYTNKYLREHSGKFPVYSSQTVNEGIIGCINSFDYDNECLTWTTDGIYAGTVFYRNGKFSMTTHCGALIPRNNINEKEISLSYIYHVLKQNLKNYAVGEQNKRVTVNIIKKVFIPIPVKNNKEFDLEAQNEISNKYRTIEEIKAIINRELGKIEKINIDFD